MHRWWPCQCLASSVPSPSACPMTKSQVFLPETHRLICDCVCNSAIQKACAGSTILSVNLMVVLPVGPLCGLAPKFICVGHVICNKPEP